MDAIAQACSALLAKPETVNAVAAIASVLVAAIALFVAALSVYVAYRTLKMQQLHNVLSVRPLPHIAVADYENRLFVKLRNNGSGPLIVKNLEINGGASPYGSLVECMPALPAGIDWSTFVGALDMRSIAAGGELTLIELEGDDSNRRFVDARDKTRAALSKLSVGVHFTDIYQSSEAPYTKSLEWFGRTLFLAAASDRR
jgi:hypothetical protein